MRTVDEHAAAVLGAVAPLGDLDLTLAEAHGCVLAEDIVASAAVPRKLGYRMVREGRRDILGNGQMRPTFAWVLARPSDWRVSGPYRR